MCDACLFQNLKWRKINRIDSILREDWTFWEREYYFDCSATDYTGRPGVHMYIQYTSAKIFAIL